jgi:hypothetical protein
MKKLVLAVAALAGVALAAPAPASAHVSLSIGLPGFGFFLGAPCPRPVVYPVPAYYPPVYYAPYYRPGPVVFGFRHHPRFRGHYGHWRHGWAR